jgi:hypothetical protein
MYFDTTAHFAKINWQDKPKTVYLWALPVMVERVSH